MELPLCEVCKKEIPVGHRKYCNKWCYRFQKLKETIEADLRELEEEEGEEEKQNKK